MTTVDRRYLTQQMVDGVFLDMPTPPRADEEGIRKHLDYLRRTWPEHKFRAVKRKTVDTPLPEKEAE